MTPKNRQKKPCFRTGSRPAPAAGRCLPVSAHLPFGTKPNGLPTGFFSIGFFCLFFGAMFFLITIAYAQENVSTPVRETIQVGGADMGALGVKSEKDKTCKIQKQGAVTRFIFNTLSGNECRLQIDLPAAIKEPVGLLVRMKGSGDTHSFKLNVGFASHSKEIRLEPAGSIFDYLPSGVTKKSESFGVVLDRYRYLGYDLKDLKHLELDFNDPAKGVVEVENISWIPRKENTKNWEPIVLRLNEYDMKSFSQFETLSIGYYGLEFGWKIGQVYKTTSTEKVFRKNHVNLLELTTKTPSIQDGKFLVADFNINNQNNLGGYFNEFFKAPSDARVTLSDENHGDGPQGKSLQIIYDKKTGGFTGAWVHLFNMKVPPKERTYLDATPFQTLSFWVKGEKGGEDASIQLADARWENEEDSVYYGKISERLKKGVTKEWQEVVVPLRKDFYKNLNFKYLAAIVWNMREKSKGTLYIDDISFLTARASAKNTPPSDLESYPVGTRHSGTQIQNRSSARSSADGQEKKKFTKAIWLWHTKRQLESPKNQIKLLEFCKRNGVNMIFFQMQYTLQKNKDGTYVCLLKYKKELQDFITRASSYGVEIQALDGFSRFALKPWHEKVLAQIRAIIDYNKSVPEKARFTGIHHDNEPYLIADYWGNQREDIMLQYLELCERSQKLVDQSRLKSGLKNFEFGVDIPFWYEERNFDYKVPVLVTWKGVQKPASHHIIDLVDNVGIMDYRTKAYGADGTIVHGKDEILYANTVGKKVLIGVETYPLPEEIFAVFRSHLYAQLTNLIEKTTHNPRLLFMMSDQFEDLSVLYVRRFRSDLKDTPDKISAEIQTLKIKQKELIYQADIAVDVPSSKLSFGGMPKARFLEEYQKTFDYFKEHPGFYGTAIHYYETYEELLEKN